MASLFAMTPRGQPRVVAHLGEQHRGLLVTPPIPLHSGSYRHLPSFLLLHVRSSPNRLPNFDRLSHYLHKIFSHVNRNRRGECLRERHHLPISDFSGGVRAPTTSAHP